VVIVIAVATIIATIIAIITTIMTDMRSHAAGIGGRTYWIIGA
jgi:hypothetical protein